MNINLSAIPGNAIEGALTLILFARKVLAPDRDELGIGLGAIALIGAKGGGIGIVGRAIGPGLGTPVFRIHPLVGLTVRLLRLGTIGSRSHRDLQGLGFGRRGTPFQCGLCGFLHALCGSGLFLLLPFRHECRIFLFLIRTAFVTVTFFTTGTVITTTVVAATVNGRHR